MQASEAIAAASLAASAALADSEGKGPTEAPAYLGKRHELIAGLQVRLEVEHNRFAGCLTMRQLCWPLGSAAAAEQQTGKQTRTDGISPRQSRGLSAHVGPHSVQIRAAQLCLRPPTFPSHHPSSSPLPVHPRPPGSLQASHNMRIKREAKAEAAHGHILALPFSDRYLEAVNDAVLNTGEGGGLGEGKWGSWLGVGCSGARAFRSLSRLSLRSSWALGSQGRSAQHGRGGAAIGTVLGAWGGVLGA